MGGPEYYLLSPEGGTPFLKYQGNQVQQLEGRCPTGRGPCGSVVLGGLSKVWWTSKERTASMPHIRVTEVLEESICALHSGRALAPTELPGV